MENKVGYHRRNLLVPVPKIEDLRAFNRHLLELCDQDMLRPHYKKNLLIKELFEEDKRDLLPLPAVEYDASELKKVSTNSYAKFTLYSGKHTYSTAPSFANSELFAKLTAHDVIVLDENYREIKRHHRLYGDHEQELMDWLPYLTQLSRRPAALKYTGIYALLPDPLQEFFNSCNYQTKKEALKILARLSEQSGFSKATEALESALAYGACDADSIVAMFSRLNSEILNLDPLTLPASIPEMPPVKANVSSYDKLFLNKQGVEIYEN